MGKGESMFLFWVQNCYVILVVKSISTYYVMFEQGGNGYDFRGTEDKEL